MAASVLARLKNKAKENGRSYQLCLQLFCQEELLRRLEKSKYAENLVLKGGLFLYSITDFDSRVTVDVDFLLRQIPNTPVSGHQWLLILKTHAHRLVSTSALAMSSYRSKKNEKYPHSLTILLPLQLIHIPLKRLLLRKLMQFSP